jgi:hypothetical protein
MVHLKRIYYIALIRGAKGMMRDCHSDGDAGTTLITVIALVLTACLSCGE